MRCRTHPDSCSPIHGIHSHPTPTSKHRCWRCGNFHGSCSSDTLDTCRSLAAQGSRECKIAYGEAMA